MREAKDKHFLKKPIYEGGPQAMKQFVAKNLKYPKAALENKVEGVVVVRYSIDKTGKVIKTKVKTGLGYGCDEEAERVVRLLRFTVPKNRKLKVVFHKTIHIRFSLPKKNTGKVEMQVSFVSSTKPSTDESNRSYSYSIDLDNQNSN
ncbi:MAG: energy transducer TonB [Saprospirales bacterium]|nr:MAG: energy transducer TonB [Saprospirales bacterium]